MCSQLIVCTVLINLQFNHLAINYFISLRIIQYDHNFKQSRVQTLKLLLQSTIQFTVENIISASTKSLLGFRIGRLIHELLC